MATRRKKTEEPSPEAVEGEQLDDKIRARLVGQDYHASPTLAKFHASQAFVRFVRGPVGSGKTTGGCEEIMRRAREQQPYDGVRRTRFAVIRNTYGMLKDTSIKTWLEWFPEEWFGRFTRTQGDMMHHVKIADIDCEVMFRALDTPADVKKVLSLELTGAFLNEVRELPKEIIDALTDRVGRFPPMRDGGPTWRGIFGDTNAPDEDHWYFELEKQPPQGWEFFIQPGGLVKRDDKWIPNPAAENLGNLERGYYETRAAGKREDHIKVYYGNEFGFVTDGKPVWPEYADHIHACRGDLVFTPGLPVYIGIGLALTSGAVFGQRKANGQWVLLDELVPDSVGAVMFAEALKAKMISDFPAGTQFRIYAKKPDADYDEDAEALQILKGRNIIASPCRISDATLRREAVAGVLSRLVTGEPALLASARCKVARKALAGGYCYQRIQASGDERYHDKPMENRYAPIAEALQYMMVGGGEASFVFHSQKPQKLKYPALGIV